MRKKKIQILLSAAAFLFLMGGTMPSVAQERKIGRVERRADRNFIRQKFDKAMAQYETAIRREKDEAGQAALHLKTARLYFMVREYGRASEHYDKAMSLRPDLLGVDDVCDYVDALRFQGQARKAEAICLDNAYKDIYSRYQRYQNTLEALAMRHSVQEDPGFSAKRLLLNTSNAEFWVGNYGEQPFYAISYSKFNDPGKLFFHRTHYYALDEPGETGVETQKPPRYYGYFRKIPADLQNGPVTFSPDMKSMVATVIEYDKEKTTVEMANRKLRPFRTKLFYSVLKNKKKRFTKYVPAFPQEEMSSYAHPYLFNEGKSLLFTSDMPGGYGGFDLYVVHWDEEAQAWGTPVNLGPDVNTEGDEIFVADGQYRMASSNNVFSLYGKTGVTTSATGVDICTVYSSRGIQPVLTLPDDCNWLTNLSVQALGSNKYKITGDFTSVANDAVATTLTMTCDNLSQPVRVSWNPIISDQKDTDSFVLDLVGSTDRNWTVRVLNPTSPGWLFLHPSAASPGALPGDGMVSELSSKYSSHAYLHVAFGASRRGTVQMTSASGGETVARKIVVIQ